MESQDKPTVLYSDHVFIQHKHTHCISISYADIILGFQQPFYSVIEGESVQACVEIFSGVADELLRLQMVSLLTEDAEGWRLYSS